jgi:hypothetical protein
MQREMPTSKFFSRRSSRPTQTFSVSAMRLSFLDKLLMPALFREPGALDEFGSLHWLRSDLEECLASVFTAFASAVTALSEASAQLQAVAGAVERLTLRKQSWHTIKRLNTEAANNEKALKEFEAQAKLNVKERLLDRTNSTGLLTEADFRRKSKAK